MKSGTPVDLRMRPRFVGHAPGLPADYLAALDAALAETADFHGSTFDTSAVVKVAERNRHFWSPQLHLALEPKTDSPEPGTDTVVRGRFSPHPTVWSGFLALYLAIAFSGIVGVIFGASQWTLGVSPTGFLAGPTAILLTALVYAAARVGRRLGRNQMAQLRAFLQSSTPLQTDLDS
ncbi:MAG: hypothetical protein HKN29_02390 [Rhodothermales bacterium]|nr:hypothetical protein [Rhodothermales bacterium]